MATLADGLATFKGQVAGHEEDSLLLRDALGGWDISAACQRKHHPRRNRTWPPLMALWTFILQVLHVHRSCRAAVALALSGREAAGSPDRASADPSAYSGARAGLPMRAYRQAVGAIVQTIRALSGGQLWHGMSVKVVDGSSVTMPDTPQLQRVFGQPRGHKPGCGFPKARIVAVFCWATGAILQMAVAAWHRSELRLWRALQRHLVPGDLVLADRLYCTFADIAWMLRRGCQGIFRLHYSRRADVDVICHLGPGDSVVSWRRPAWGKDRPRGICRQQWEQLPPTLLVRIIHRNLEIPGFRTHELVVVTTLLDGQEHQAEEIAELYRDRWLAELRLRDIKITMGMDMLRCRKARTVLRELQVHLLAYNMVRLLMWQAAQAHGRPARRMSFKGSLDRLNAALPYLDLFRGHRRHDQIAQRVLAWIARDPVPHRANRVEPRMIKRRAKYPYLTRPRRELQMELQGNSLTS